MNLLTKLSLFALTLAGLGGCSAIASANDLYIAQNSAGLGNGQDCANPRPSTYFNLSNIWVNANPIAAQIGPGTTVHLCGTISTALAVQRSGKSGNPITILFEAGAKISRPSCGSTGCLNISGKSYLIVDGGVDGTIEATNSGTGLGSGNSIGVYARSGTSNSELRNLNINNMYVHVGLSDTSNGNYYAIWFDGNNNLFHDIRIQDTMGGIKGEAPGSGNQIFRNVIHRINWGVFLSGGNDIDSITNNAIYANEIYDFANWDTTADAYHHDGVFVAGGNNRSTSASYIDIYNNYIHGTASSCCTTAYIYLNDLNHTRVFNNLLMAPAGTYVNNAWILVGASGIPDFSNAAFNNTIIGGTRSDGGCVYIKSQASFSFENNVSSNCSRLLWTTSDVTFSVLDNNVYQSSNLSGAWQVDSSTYNSLADWQTASHADAHAQALAGSLNLDGNFKPLPNSIVVGAGANLAGLGATTLDLDKAGVTRPSSGAWDAGVYQLNGSGASVPFPPTGLTTAVH